MNTPDNEIPLLDESKLIQYMSADRTYKLQNGNAGLVDHTYYQCEQYLLLFKNIWEKLQKQSYATLIFL